MTSVPHDSRDRLATLLGAEAAALPCLALLDSCERDHFADQVEAQIQSREQAVEDAMKRAGTLLPGPLRRLVIRRFFAG